MFRQILSPFISSTNPFHTFVLDDCIFEDYKCIKCDPQNSSTCLKCADNYFLDSQSNKCVSSCSDFLYLNQSTQQCVAVCDFNQVENDENIDCKNIQTCPTIQAQSINFHNEEIKGLKEVYGQYLISYDVSNKIYITNLSNNTDSQRIDHQIQETIIGIEEIQYNSLSALVWTESSISILNPSLKKVILFRDFAQQGKLSKEIAIWNNTLDSLSIFLQKQTGEMLAYDILNDKVLLSIKIDNFSMSQVLRLIGKEKQFLITSTLNGNILYIDLINKSYKVLQSSGYILSQNSFNDTSFVYFSSFSLYIYDINQKQQSYISYPSQASPLAYMYIYPQYKLMVTMKKNRTIYLLSYNVDTNNRISSIDSLQEILCQSQVDNQCDESVVIQLQSNYFLLGTQTSQKNSFGFSVGILFRMNFKDKRIIKVRVLSNRKWNYYLGSIYYYSFQKKLEYYQLTQQSNDGTYQDPQTPYSYFKSNFSFTKSMIYYEIINIYSSSLFVIAQDSQNFFYFFDPVKLSIVYTAQLQFTSIYIKDNDIVAIDSLNTYFFKIKRNSIVNIYTQPIKYCNAIYFHPQFIFEKCDSIFVRYNRTNLKEQITSSATFNTIIIQNNMIYSIASYQGYADQYYLNFTSVYKSKYIGTSSGYIYQSANKTNFLGVGSSKWYLYDSYLNQTKVIVNSKLLQDYSKYQLYLYNEIYDYILVGYDQTIFFYKISTDAIEKTITSNLMQNKMAMFTNQQNYLVILFNNTNFESLAFVDLRSQTLLNIFQVSSIKSQQIIYDDFRDSLHFYSTISFNKFYAQLNSYTYPTQQVKIIRNKDTCQNKIFLQYDITFISCYSSSITLGVFTYSNLTLIREKEFSIYQSTFKIDYIPQISSILVSYIYSIFKYNYLTDQTTKLYDEFWSLYSFYYFESYFNIIYQQSSSFVIKDVISTNQLCNVNYTYKQLVVSDYLSFGGNIYLIGQTSQSSTESQIYKIQIQTCEINQYFLTSMKNVKFFSSFSNNQIAYISADTQFIVYDLSVMKILTQYLSNTLQLFYDEKFIYLINLLILQTEIKIINPSKGTIFKQLSINTLKPIFIYYFQDLQTIYAVLQNQIYILDEQGNMNQLIQLPLNISTIKVDYIHGLFFLYSSLNQICICDYINKKQIDFIQVQNNLSISNSDYDYSSNYLQANDGINLNLIDLSISMQLKSPIQYAPVVVTLSNNLNYEKNWVYIFDDENQIWRYSSFYNFVELVSVNKYITTQSILNEQGFLITSNSNSVFCIDGNKVLDSKLIIQPNVNSTTMINLFSFVYSNRLFIASNNNQKIDEVICSSKGIEINNLIQTNDYAIQGFIVFKDNTVIAVDEYEYLIKPLDIIQQTNLIQVKGFIRFHLINQNYFLIQFNDKIELYTKDTQFVGRTDIASINEVYSKIDKLLLMLSNQRKKLFVYSYDINSLTKIYEIYLPCQFDNSLNTAFNYLLIICPIQVNVYLINNLQLQFIQTLPVEKPSQFMVFDNQFLMINLKRQIMIYKKSEQQGFKLFKQIKQVNILVMDIKLKENRFLVEYEFALLQEQQLKTFIFVTKNPSYNLISTCYNDIVDVSDTVIDLIVDSFLENQIIYGKEYYQNVFFNIYASPTVVNSLKMINLDNLGFQIRYLSRGSDRLIIDYNLFKQYTLQNLIISNAILQMNGTDQVQSNSKINRIILNNIIIENSIQGQIQFSSLIQVIINNFSIKNVSIETQGTIFQFKQQAQLFLRNINLARISIDNPISSIDSLIDISSINYVSIQNLIMEDIQNLSIGDVFRIQQLDYLIISDIKITNIQSNLNYCNLFQVNAAIDSKLQDIELSDLTKISFLQIQSTYISYNQQIENLSDKLKMIRINIQNIELIERDHFCNTEISQVLIVDSYFNNIRNKEAEGYTVFSFQKGIINIQNSKFINCSSSQGAIYAKQLNIFSSIEDSLFTQCNSYQTGGAFNLINCNIFFINNTIHNNTAQIGGAIYYEIKKPIFTTQRQIVDLMRNLQIKNDLNEQKNQIFLNKAQFYGQNIGSSLTEIQIVNDDSVGNIQFQKISKNKFQINNFRSGDFIKFKISLIDEEGNNLKINKEKIKIAPDRIKTLISQLKLYINPQEEKSIQLNNQLLLSLMPNDSTMENQFSSSEIKIIGNPKQQSVLSITSEYMKIIDENQYYNQEKFESLLYINFRDCYVGEVFEKREDVTSCKPCENGFYSLLQPIDNKENKCTACPDSAFKCEKNNIYLKEGYWRRSNYTDNILECFNQRENCKGSNDGNRFYCDEGKIGALCETCDYHGVVWDEKYMRMTNFKCKKCSETSQYIFLLPLIGIIIFILIYIIFSVNVSIKMSKGFTIAQYFRRTGLMSMGASAMRDLTPFYVKQLMHYLQIVNIVNIYKFDLPSILTFIPDIISLPIENIEYSFDCVLNDIDWGIPITFLRAFWSLLIPFLFLTSTGIIYFALILLKQVKHNKFYVFNGLFFMLIFLQTSIVSTLISIISCRNIDGVFYIRNDTSFQCYTKNHIKFSLFIIFPGLLAWLFIVPLIILKKLYDNKENLEQLTVRFKFGFLYQEFKGKYYYWEFIKSYKKILIVIIHNIFLDYAYQRLVLIAIILLIYNQLIHKLQPYKNINFNKLDLRIVNTLLLILLFNILLKDNNRISPILHTILSSSIATFHYFTFLKLIILVIYYKITASFVQCLLKFQNLISTQSIFSCLKIDFKKPINCARASKNWRKVQYFSYLLIERKKYGQWLDPLHSQNILKNVKVSLNKTEKDLNVTEEGLTRQSKFSSGKSLSKYANQKTPTVKFKDSLLEDQIDQIYLMQPDKKNSVTKQIRRDLSENYSQSNKSLQNRLLVPRKVQIIINDSEGIKEEQTDLKNENSNNIKLSNLSYQQHQRITITNQSINQQSSNSISISQQPQNVKSKIGNADLESNSSESSFSEDNLGLGIKCTPSKYSYNGEEFKENPQVDLNQLRDSQPQVHHSSSLLKFYDENNSQFSPYYRQTIFSQTNTGNLYHLNSQIQSQVEIDQGHENSNYNSSNMQFREIQRGFKDVDSSYYYNNKNNNDLSDIKQDLANYHINNFDSFDISQIASGTQLNFQKNTHYSEQNKKNDSNIDFIQKKKWIQNENAQDSKFSINKVRKQQKINLIPQVIDPELISVEESVKNKVTYNKMNFQNNHFEEQVKLSVSKGLIQLSEKSEQNVKENEDTIPDNID